MKTSKVKQLRVKIKLYAWVVASTSKLSSYHPVVIHVVILLKTFLEAKAYNFVSIVG